MDNTDELRQSCHRMVDALNDPGLLGRARRFLTYLYLYKEPDIEKARWGCNPNGPKTSSEDGEPNTTC